jgi:hypothetical protein
MGKSADFYRDSTGETGISQNQWEYLLAFSAAMGGSFYFQRLKGKFC